MQGRTIQDIQKPGALFCWTNETSEPPHHMYFVAKHPMLKDRDVFREQVSKYLDAGIWRNHDRQGICLGANFPAYSSLFLIAIIFTILNLKKNIKTIKPIYIYINTKFSHLLAAKLLPSFLFLSLSAFCHTSLLPSLPLLLPGWKIYARDVQRQIYSQGHRVPPTISPSNIRQRCFPSGSHVFFPKSKRFAAEKLDAKCSSPETELLFIFSNLSSFFRSFPINHH